MRIFQSHHNASQDDILLFFLEVEVEFFELLADESDGQDGHFFDDGIIVIDVLGYFLDDPRPFITRNLDAADCCDDLYYSFFTLAAALLTNFWESIMELRMRSLKPERVGAGKESHRKSLLFWMGQGVL